MKFRRRNEPRLEPESARRQGDVTRAAFMALGREAAIAFLNAPHSALGGRPLDLAIASEAGQRSVTAELERLRSEDAG